MSYTQAQLSTNPALSVEKKYNKTAMPIALTPNRVASMLMARRNYQVIKFRSTCSDCVPNL